MGVRSYVPALGRFLTPDPVFGGSANQDPINNYDLDGKKCAGKSQSWISRCKQLKQWAHRSTKNRAIVLNFRNKMAAQRFADYLRDNSNLLKKLQEKIGGWDAASLADLQRRAREKAELPKATPVRCADIATGLGVSVSYRGSP